MLTKEDFITFLIEHDILTFGEFITKSGRKTPYFINTGNYNNGQRLSAISEFYAEAIHENFKNATMLFGPAYKGIPLVSVVSLKLFEKYKVNLSIAFNRKEAKDHGEGGIIVGHKPSEIDKVVIVEDVVTSGISISESIEILKSNGNPQILGAVISVDRMERGKGKKTAIQELQEEFGIKIIPIITIKDILDFLSSREIPKYSQNQSELVKKMIEYLKENSPLEI
jgi:orotate phosphoribosyltransferase